MKHYGTHSCSPIKQIKADEILREISANPNKAAKARRDILFSMIKEGADYESVADKASKLMDRSALNRAKLVKNGLEVSDLLNLREKYSKNDKFLLYKMNDRALNNNPTFIFKTSLTALEIASQLNRESNHFLSSCYVYFDANEKRTKNMTVFTLSAYHPLLQK